MQRPIIKSDADIDVSDLVEFSVAENVLTIRFVAPALGQAEAPMAAGAIFRKLVEHEGPSGVVVLDLSAVCAMSSMGLGLCIEIRNQVLKAGGRCIAFGLCQHLVELFGMMRLDRVFTIVDSPQTLAAAIRG